MKNRIKEIMKEQDYGSVSRLARHIGHTREHIAAVIKNKSIPSAEIALKICKELGRPFEDVFFDDNVKTG